VSLRFLKTFRPGFPSPARDIREIVVDNVVDASPSNVGTVRTALETCTCTVIQNLVTGSVRPTPAWRVTFSPCHDPRSGSPNAVTVLSNLGPNSRPTFSHINKHTVPVRNRTSTSTSSTIPTRLY